MTSGHSFHKFAQILPKDGYLIINGGIDNLQEITGDLPCNVITFGKDPSCDYSYTDVTFLMNLEEVLIPY